MPTCRHCQRHFDFNPKQPRKIYCRRACNNAAHYRRQNARKAADKQERVGNARRKVIEGECIYCKPLNLNYRAKASTGTICVKCKAIQVI